MTDNITLPRATVQQVLKTLEGIHRVDEYPELQPAVTALRAALKQQAEPVATHRITAWGHCGVCRHDRIPGEGCARQECPDSPQQQAEPVAWVVYGNVSDEKHAVDYQQEDIDAISVGTMLYTAPPQRKWVGLTEAERIDIIDEEIASQNTEHFALAQAIETKLKEKNT